ncbi:hypothetical protein Tco_0797669, partial [Tanacetum coccineum]
KDYEMISVVRAALKNFVESRSSRLPVPLPEDPYEAIRQAYLDGSDTESEPFKDPVETETLESLPDSTPPIYHVESEGSDTSGVRSTSSDSTAPLSPDHPLTHTTPALVPILRRTARMAMHVPPAMSSGLSASIAEVEAMSESAFRKRFRSSYKSSPSLSPLDLPSRKRYRGTSELVEDSEEDDDEEDEEIEESLDSNSLSEDAEDEGPTVEDEDPATGDEGLAAGVEGPGMRDESHGMDDKSHGLDDESRSLDDKAHSVESDGLGLEEEEAVPEGQQQAVLVVGTVVSAPLGLGYGALRRRELALEEDQVYSTFEVGQGSGSAPESKRRERVSASRQHPEDGMVYIDVPAYPPPLPVQTPPSPEWTSGSLPISPSPSVVPLPVSSPMIPLTVPSPVASPATVETEGFLTELRARRDARGLIRDHAVRLEELSPALFERSLEYKQEQVTVTFGAIWRPVLALESWHAISDMQGENQDLRLQLAEERRALLELAKVVDGMRRGQEPRGDA